MNKAIYYFRIAANDNNTFAEYQLGKINLYGYGVEKDYDIAMHYLHLSAKHGNQYAEQLLYSIQKQKNIMAAMGSLRSLQHISNLIRKKIRSRTEEKSVKLTVRCNRRLMRKNKLMD